MAGIQEMIAELEQETVATRRCLERVPETHLDWRPHEKSLTLGQLAMHIATLPQALAGLSMQTDFEGGTRIPRPSAASVAELLSTLEASVAGARAILASMDDAALDTPWRMTQGGHEVVRIPRGAFLRAILFNHWYHHRGQLTVYLRQAGALVPAIYGDSADEMPFA